MDFRARTDAAKHANAAANRLSIDAIARIARTGLGDQCPLFAVNAAQLDAFNRERYALPLGAVIGLFDGGGPKSAAFNSQRCVAGCQQGPMSAHPVLVVRKDAPDQATERLANLHTRRRLARGAGSQQPEHP
jgi:hypothetical protein